ncbi:TRAP transporter small permease [Zobellella maritima]|uniref:TRAP transporter small permease n=1 Tax=Zobellella maritima TaxID=2059725 RepID=UPI000E306575|nr:TRAP transporter small permease [Zobellella maritima]
MIAHVSRIWCDSAAAIKRMLNLLAGLMLLLMMLITAVDVVGRYLFNQPLMGGAELIEIMLAASIFLILPTITWHNEHVSVDLVEPWLPRWLRAARDRLCHLFMTAGCAYMAMTVWKLADRAARYHSVSEYLAIPSAWAMYLIGVSLWLTALTFLVMSLLGKPDATSSSVTDPAQEAPAL